MTNKTTFKSKVKEVGVLDAGWTTFSILFKKDIKSDNDDCLGLVDWDTSEIQIEDSAKDSILKETLLHEIIHVLLSTIWIKADDEDCHIPLSFTNEYLTEQTSRGLILLQRLNPDLWDLIFNDKGN